MADDATPTTGPATCACGCGQPPKPGNRYIHGHNARGMTRIRESTPLMERFWPKVNVDPDGCWEWTGHRDRHHYGRINLAAAGNQRVVYAHRVAYEDVYGPIPEGLVLDHLCRNPPCVRPSHLQAVTNRVNIFRGMAPTILIFRSGCCKRGHPYSEHRYVSPKGKGYCRLCRALTRGAA